MRTFPTGATRDSDDDKPQFGGYLCPLVLQRFGQYMLKHQTQADGQKREAGNWKKGMPDEAYFESLLRHVLDVWLLREGHPAREADIEDVLCAILFNVQGLLRNQLLKSAPDPFLGHLKQPDLVRSGIDWGRALHETYQDARARAGLGEAR